MILLIEEIKNYFDIDVEDTALKVEKLIELAETPLASYFNEDILNLLLEEDALLEESFIDIFIDNYLEGIENTLQDVLSDLENDNEYIEYLVYDKPEELVDSYYELIDTSIDVDTITIE
ncbi:hypothetical protein [Paraclostridium sordellii]|uniref:hypothetical protein n=1 Tax=Paraclostridium sordellii TaxID=1505 RepID=UPI0005DE1D51|nr:hypothetical protein [Paeniclostridium sordellii]CEO25221.1 Uncharacterised protein [[Clostridium] sordellii] [Paeniclostridium sordellii]